MIPKDFTTQEQLVAQCLDELGLRYAQQVEIDRYTVDFLVEDDIVVEADGYYGHSRKSDNKRNAILLEYKERIVHITSQTKEQIKLEIEVALCLESQK